MTMPSPYYCITSYEPCNIGTCLTCRTSQPGTAYPYMTGAFVNNNVNLAAACFPDLPVHRCGEQVTVVTIQSACCSVPAGEAIVGRQPLDGRPVSFGQGLPVDSVFEHSLRQPVGGDVGRV